MNKLLFENSENPNVTISLYKNGFKDCKKADTFLLFFDYHNESVLGRGSCWGFGTIKNAILHLNDLVFVFTGETLTNKEKETIKKLAGV